MLDTIFKENAERQYTRDLLFSSVFQLMGLVVFGVRPSLRSAYEKNRDRIEVSLTAVYNRVNGIDLATSRAMVQETTKRMGREIEALGGNCIEATHHRIEALRTEGGGALPGKSLVVYDRSGSW